MSELEQKARLAAEKIVPQSDTRECPWCLAHPHRDPCCFQCGSARVEKRDRNNMVDEVAAVIASTFASTAIGDAEGAWEVLDLCEAAMSAAIPFVPRDLEIALRERIKAVKSLEAARVKSIAGGAQECVKCHHNEVSDGSPLPVGFCRTNISRTFSDAPIVYCGCKCVFTEGEEQNKNKG